MVPPALLVTCLLVMMALGVSVVAKAVTHPPLGGQSQISLWGSKLELKGPAWLIMILVGALIAAVPIGVALVQRDTQVSYQPPEPAQVVSTIAEPEYRSFRFLKDASVLDLRTALNRPWYSYLPLWSRIAGPHAHIRPATLLNYMVIRKVGDADAIHITYASGGALDLRCVTHSCTARTSMDGAEQIGELTADVRAVPIGTEFTLITEVTYWNAFSGEAGDDYTTYSHDQRDSPEELSVLLLFPEGRPATGVNAFEKLGDEGVMRDFSGQSQTHLSPQKDSYYWSTVKSGAGRWFYTLKWTW